MPEVFEHMVQREKPNREQEALRVARELHQHTPDWVTFFREVLGVDGVVSQLFDDPEQLEEFKKSESFAEIQNLLNELRQQSQTKAEDDKEPQRVITVRLPKSLHESLRAEAHAMRTSMNKLCISKLLLAIEEEANGAETTQPMDDESLM